MEKMYYKKNKTIVDLYKIKEDGTAVVFIPTLANQQYGNGWQTVKLGQLVPIEYWNENLQKVMTKTQKNQIKDRLKLIKAEWECTDGIVYENCEEAIIHESEIMAKEKENDAE